MRKHKALLVSFDIQAENLPQRVQNKIAKYNKIEGNVGVGWVKTNSGEPTQRKIDELSELDEDICDLIHQYIADNEPEEEKVEQPPVIIKKGWFS